MKLTKKISLIAGLVSLLFVFFPLGSSAAQCEFARDLEIGMDGEDIRCLQQYLNGAGFIIATEGVGSPGHETSLFRDLTKEAIIKWQTANGISPASGYFGPLSREKFIALSSDGTPLATTPPATSNEVTALKEQISVLQTQVETYKSKATISAENKNAKDAITKAIENIEEAEDQIDDATESGAAIGNAKDNLEDARENVFDAVVFYFKGDFVKTLKYAEDAIDEAGEAFEDAGGESDEDKADAFIEEVEDEIDKARDAIEEADDDGESVGEAEDLLEEAEDKLSEAQDAFDDD